MLSKKQKDWWDTFTPRSLTGLTLWLDDPSIPSNIIESSNRVSQWFDQSGNSNNFPQSVGLDQGLRTDNFIEYDGSSEFQDGTGVLSSFAGDASGELFIVVHELEGTGVATFLFNAGISGAASDQLIFIIDGGDDLSLQIRIAGVTNTIIFSACPRSQKVLLNWRSNGSSYAGEVNGADSPITSATDDNGDWFADVPLVDTLALSALIRGVSIFSNNRLYSAIYYNRELSVAERLNVTTFLNNRFTVF